MPTYTSNLDEMSTVKFSANVPYVKGRPRVMLKKYSICPHKVVAPVEEAPAAGVAAAEAGAAAEVAAEAGAEEEVAAAPVDPPALDVPTIAIDPPVRGEEEAVAEVEAEIEEEPTPEDAADAPLVETTTRRLRSKK